MGMLLCRRFSAQSIPGVRQHAGRPNLFNFFIFFYFSLSRMPRTVKQSKGKGKQKQPAQTKRKRIPAGTMSLLGSAAGAGIGGIITRNPMGVKAGAAAGAGIGQAIASFTGLGAYRIRSNVLMPGLPQVVNRSKHPGAHIIRKREYLTDVISASTARTFSNRSFAINAGLGSTFPFLSQIAQNYEEYQFEGLVFEFRSLSADALNSVDTSLGSVVLATVYNAASAPFTTKAEMEEYEYAHSVRPSQSLFHFVECDPAQNVLGEQYVRSGAVPSGQDQRMYDLGTFQVATAGMQGTSVNVGEIWVTYQVALMRPKLFTALQYSQPFYHCFSLTGVSAAAPLGTSNSPTATSTMIPAADTTSTTFTFPRVPYEAIYEVTISYSGTAAVIGEPVMTLAGGSVAKTLYNGNNTFDLCPANGETSTDFIGRYGVRVPGNSVAATISFGTAGTLPTALTKFDFRVLQMNSNFS